EKKSRYYYLGDEFPNVYFTQREIDCLFYLLAGYTIAETAERLGLSPRTVEFYVKNMRMKIGVKNKADLLKKIRESSAIDWLTAENIKSSSNNYVVELLDNK
ncbi:MAG: helix-turn-helix transcriptional regulator, partial [Coxiellaceae bacterium]|nr:helix-turn-helix transcriptional regulator [Coxiellaceae bacterium]